MAQDPNGEEAGKQFLEENGKRDGVITRASGLQYKVLAEGTGFEHPTVDSPCECHYAGRLLDGTEFDSSYQRGAPNVFAPNQVIKGWTEAMQLMVQGDKWEMYIPYELAYGKSGKPPKIPPAACLIFVMEICKIKGGTVPAQITYPEWTAEQLALWTAKDEASCVSWREAKEKSWQQGGKLKEQHATREEFDAWLDKQCLTAKNKSLWKRTRKKEEPQKEKEPPKLTKETARELLTKAIDSFKQPANKEKLKGLAKQCEEGAGGAQADMMKMFYLTPAIREMVGGLLVEYGFESDDLMGAATQIQAFAPEDPSIVADAARLTKVVDGDFSELLSEVTAD